jgi:Protein of unknown function (DUF2726)
LHFSKRPFLGAELWLKSLWGPLKAAGPDRKQANAARNRFAQKIVDFVVVTRETAEVVAIIELDDRTHSAAKDARRDAMTASAGYRTIRINSKPRSTTDSLKAALADPEISQRQ